MLGMFLDVLPVLVLIVVSFACGYGVRELKSRRRRAAIQEKILQSASGRAPIEFWKLRQPRVPRTTLKAKEVGYKRDHARLT